jgi:hypothetical protein
MDMTWELITAANWAYARAHHGTCPRALDPFDTVLGKPLEGRLQDFALIIRVSICQRRQRHTRPRTRSRILLGVINDSEPIVVSHISSNGVKAGKFNNLEMRSKLLKDD